MYKRESVDLLLTFSSYLGTVTGTNPTETGSDEWVIILSLNFLPAKTTPNTVNSEPCFLPQCELASASIVTRGQRGVHPVQTQSFEMQNALEDDTQQVMQNPDGASVGAESQTTAFIDPNHQEAYLYPERDLSPFQGDTQEHLDLADFLKRPTKIYTTSWSGGFTSTTINPWSLFFSNTVIKNKIQNFAYFSGNLHVRVVINTNPFLYGSMLVNYQPLFNYTDTPTALNQLVCHSQLPHIMVEPQVNDGGEMVLPFIYHKQFVDITVAANVASLGQMNLISMAPLSSASETYSGAITLTLYAWVEEPKLFGPTTKLALQNDEYGNGPVSGPAAHLSRFASMFSATPIIGKWATATSIGASAVSSIAKLFGWSNVPVIEDAKPVKITYYHDIASAHISEPTNKVTLDPKAEISVDPTIIGVKNEDSLAISKIAQHESYLWSSLWSSTNVQGDILFSAAVSPRMFVNSTPDGNGTSTIQQTPMCMLSELFTHWRGDLIFKFRFISSKFHRGRVIMAFDPVGDLTGITDTGNTAITKIVDIGETTDYEFRIPYMQALPWLASTKSVDSSTFFSDSAIIAPSAAGFANGTISVRVLNALTAPRASSAVYMQVWVRGSDNLEYANPTDVQKSLFPWALQNAVETSSPSDERYKINWGEPIPSLRLLFRRSVLSENLQMNPGTAADRNSTHYNRFTRFPVPPGYGNGALTAKSVSSASQIAYAYARFTPLHYTARCFLANRGSFRYHFVPAFGTSRTLMNVTRHVDNSVGSSDVGIMLNQTQRSSAEALNVGANRLIRDDLSEAASGSVIVDTYSTAGLTIECPMMTNYLFSFNKLDSWARGSNVDGTSLDTYVLTLLNSPAAGTTQDNYFIQKYVAAGTDFNLFFFLCVPPLYYNSTTGGTPT